MFLDGLRLVVCSESYLRALILISDAICTFGMQLAQTKYDILFQSFVTLNPAYARACIAQAR